jgi:hypothetical protein
MSVWLRQPLLLGQQPDEGNGIHRASCLATRQANRRILYSELVDQPGAGDQRVPVIVYCLPLLLQRPC